MCRSPRAMRMLDHARVLPTMGSYNLGLNRLESKVNFNWNLFLVILKLLKGKNGSFELFCNQFYCFGGFPLVSTSLPLLCNSEWENGLCQLFLFLFLFFFFFNFWDILRVRMIFYFSRPPTISPKNITTQDIPKISFCPYIVLFTSISWNVLLLSYL